MPVETLSLRLRWARVRADPRVRKALRHVLLVAGVTLLTKALSRLCVHLPHDFHAVCRAATEAARALGLSVGGG